jgi:solute carrier family 25 oxoglutarate transporter 11
MQLYGQLNPGKPIPSFPTLLKNMVANDGFLSIYKGVDAAIGRQLVYGTARIGLHRKISDKLVEINAGQPISFVQKALSGMLSGSIAVCIGTPFDIALVRLQADGMAKPEDRRNYKNVFDVSCSMLQVLRKKILLDFAKESRPFSLTSQNNCLKHF